jgi:hypothetical protein
MCGCCAWTAVVLFDNSTNDGIEFGQNKVMRQSEGRYTKGSRKELEERMNERDFIIRWLSG